MSRIPSRGPRVTNEVIVAAAVYQLQFGASEAAVADYIGRTFPGMGDWTPQQYVDTALYSMAQGEDWTLRLQRRLDATVAGSPEPRLPGGMTELGFRPGEGPGPRSRRLNRDATVTVTVYYGSVPGGQYRNYIFDVETGSTDVDMANRIFAEIERQSVNYSFHTIDVSWWISSVVDRLG